jgi:Ca2+-binding RTX toxin-like protein
MAGDDTLIDASGQKKAKSDGFSGGDGNDTIYLHWGSDFAQGGAGNDTIISRSDAGEPLIAQNGNTTGYFSNQPVRDQFIKDVLTGGTGADTFQFRFDVDAKASILAKHIEAHSADNEHGGPGTIDWEGVTGENNAAHDHWVQSIGKDMITDFSRAEGDKIEFYGHTVAINNIQNNVDVNGDGKLDSIVNVKSEQGAAGAHDEDNLGSLVVLGVADITANDITIHAEVHLGAFGSIDDMYVA